MVDTSKIPASRVDIDWDKIEELTNKSNEFIAKFEEVMNQFNGLVGEFDLLKEQISSFNEQFNELPKHIVVDELPEEIDENTFYYISEKEEA